MTLYKTFRSLLLLTTATISFTSFATIVEFRTSEGNFQVNLHDETTPATVNNFLQYVNDGDYVGTIFHRSVSDFIIQGGGFTFEGSLPPTPIASNATVNNEPKFSNVRGTIAMAKGSNANSATNQWFFNLKNNSTNLDVKQNSGGFTVFGEVIDTDTAGDGIAVINAIAKVPLCNIDGNVFSTTPMPDFTCSSGNVPGAENFVTVNQIIIVDSSPATASTLTPVANTLINAPSTPTPTTPDNSSSGGGGSLAWLSLGLVGLLSFSRRLYK